MSVPTASRSSLPGDGEKTCREAVSTISHKPENPNPNMWEPPESKTQTLSNSTAYASLTGLWSKNGLKYTNRNSTHKTTEEGRYFYPQGILGNTTVNATCAQQRISLRGASE